MRGPRQGDCTRHPQIRVRVVGLNSSEVADAVRNGDLEAGLVALPVDDRGLDVGPVVWTSEAVYLSTDQARTTRPVTPKIWPGAADPPRSPLGQRHPTRRQLLECAQKAGVALLPKIEVESPASALSLAARGVGDTVISLPLAQYLGCTDRLHWAPLGPRCTKLSPSSPAATPTSHPRPRS